VHALHPQSDDMCAFETKCNLGAESCRRPSLHTLPAWRGSGSRVLNDNRLARQRDAMPMDVSTLQEHGTGCAGQWTANSSSSRSKAQEVVFVSVRTNRLDDPVLAPPGIWGASLTDRGIDEQGVGPDTRSNAVSKLEDLICVYLNSRDPPDEQELDSKASTTSPWTTFSRQLSIQEPESEESSASPLTTFSRQVTMQEPESEETSASPWTTFSRQVTMQEPESEESSASPWTTFSRQQTMQEPESEESSDSSWTSFQPPPGLTVQELGSEASIASPFFPPLGLTTPLSPSERGLGLPPSLPKSPAMPTALSLAAALGTSKGVSSADDLGPQETSPPPEVWSRGSVGHPHACADACKYFWKKKGCKDGASCKRCHLCTCSRQQTAMLPRRRRRSGCPHLHDAALGEACRLPLSVRVCGASPGAPCTG